MKIQAYSAKIEAQMRNFYHSLSEKDRRRYAAIEKTQCDDRLIIRGQQELEIDLSNEEQRIRKSGGGRKFLLATSEGIEAIFLAVLENHMDNKSRHSSIGGWRMENPCIVPLPICCYFVIAGVAIMHAIIFSKKTWKNWLRN